MTPAAVAERDLPSLTAIDDARQAHGITALHFSEALGFSNHTGWATALRQDTLSPDKHRRAIAVLAYVDEHGYLPEPNATDLDVPDDPTGVIG